MEGVEIIILIIVGCIIAIGCIIRNYKHDVKKSKFELSVEELTSVEIEGDHYLIYFDASRFPVLSDNWQNNFLYYPELTINRTGYVNKGDFIANIKIIQETFGATPSTGSYKHKEEFKEYHIHSPYNGILSLYKRKKNDIGMSKFVVCEIKPQDEDNENIKNNILSKYKITESYYKNVINVCSKLLDFKNSLALNVSAICAQRALFKWPDNDTNEHFTHIIINDVIKCFEKLGLTISLDSKEGYALLLLTLTLTGEKKLPEYEQFEQIFKSAPTSANYIQCVKSTFENKVKQTMLF